MKENGLRRTDTPEARSRTVAATLPRLSPRLQRWFFGYARRYIRRHFDRVRVVRTEMTPLPDDSPLLVYLNHSSWWDPLLCCLLAQQFFPDRAHYAPMDAQALRSYPLLSRLGFFGVEPGRIAGARAFLDHGRAIAAKASTGLWITPQGRFADPRERPLKLAAGLGRLVAGLESGRVIPVAIEYPFGQERLPEVVILIGETIDLSCVPRHSASGWSELLASRLEAAQDRLAVHTVARNDAPFDTMLSGRRGVGVVYDGWRYLQARFRGETFRPGHGQPEA